MEEGKQVQKILTKQDETTEEEEPSSIEIDFTQASEIDNGGNYIKILILNLIQKNFFLNSSKLFNFSKFLKIIFQIFLII
ncbi:unnamed protein product [Meloidogyne enterolobii]|uniref:Uncharacterized protein n=1 Tax=Meloidogyne enterolobii TaxID=390850 RepID=A0ACB0YPN1_MELEN